MSADTRSQNENAHAGGIATRYVTQTINGGDWFGVGIYDFDTGTSGSMTIASITGSSGRHNADAARFTESLLGITFGMTAANTTMYSDTGVGWEQSGVARRNNPNLGDTAGATALFQAVNLVHTSLIESITLELVEYSSSHSNRTADSTFKVYDGDLASLIHTGTLTQSGAASSVLGQFTFFSGKPVIEFIASGTGYMEAGPISMELVGYTLIPEPASLILLAAGWLTMLRRGRGVARPSL